MELRRELSEAEKIHRRDAVTERQQEVTTALARLQIGDVIAMPGRNRPVLAVVMTPANQSRDPQPWVTTESGWSGRIEAESFSNVPITIGHMRLSRGWIEEPRRNARRVAEQFRREHFKRPKKMREFARVRPNARITELREEIRGHEAHHWPDREQLARSAERLIRRERDLAKLTGQVSKAKETLGRTFDRLLSLLGEMDYVDFADPDKPVITGEGERLAKIHTESDLLVAQCLKRGIWDGLDPAELAGVVSMCVFENRRDTGGTAEAVTEAMAGAMNNTERIWDELVEDERRHRLPVTRAPEAGFATAVHQWAAGAPLGYCMAAAAENGAELTPGDFVRWCRQVIDLLEQVAKTSYDDDTTRTARQAVDAIRRGVVAIGS